jgi:ABC-2 type transport system ATP-binding protein
MAYNQNGGRRMEWCIETEELTKDFGSFRAVDSLSIQVPKGSFYGFLGPNGAGKSTTIKMLTGLLAPSAGRAVLLGHDLTAEPLKVKADMGVVPEDLCLFENLTGAEYLIFTGRMYGLDNHTIRERSGELLRLLGIEDERDKLILEYSHGMKKKVSIASALLHDPDLLFLDEPFEGIDAITARTVRGVLERFTERGSTIFLTSHILEIVQKLCSHVGIIHRGQLAKQGALEEVAGDGSLEEAFIEAVGKKDEPEMQLSWLAGEA